MSEALLILAPLRIERLALGTPPGSAVLRTGMGPRRARIAAARALAHGAPAVAVAGLCAGVDPALRAGDVVCASELVAEGGVRVEVPGSSSSPRRFGGAASASTSARSRRPAGSSRPAERRRARRASRSRSTWSRPGSRPAPAAGRSRSCRVVADAAGRSLADPRLALEGLRALRSLRRTGPALAEWAAAAGAEAGPGRAGAWPSAADAEERAAPSEPPRRRLAQEPAR